MPTGFPRRALNSLIIVPALYLTLHHYPQARLFALVALGRHNGRPVVKTMECDREALLQIAIRDRSLKRASSE